MRTTRKSVSGFRVRNALSAWMLERQIQTMGKNAITPFSAFWRYQSRKTVRETVETASGAGMMVGPRVEAVCGQSVPVGGRRRFVLREIQLVYARDDLARTRSDLVREQNAFGRTRSGFVREQNRFGRPDDGSASRRNAPGMARRDGGGNEIPMVGQPDGFVRAANPVVSGARTLVSRQNRTVLETNRHSQTKKEVVMDRGGRSTLKSFQRVQEFLTQNGLSDAPAGLGAQAATLADVVSRLMSESVDQEAGTRYVRVHAESQKQAREALLKDHMLPVSRVAREVFGVTGMDKAFRMPRLANVNQPVLAAAGTMAEAAGKMKDVFLEHGLPADFIEQLTAAAAALNTARNARAESARRRVTATAAVADQLKRGRKAVRLLNAILAPKLAKDPELNAAWESARRVPQFVAAPTDAAVTAPASATTSVAPAPEVKPITKAA